MIGFDKTIKPKWIYDLLNIIKIDDLPKNYYTPFEDIAQELIGKESKRKIRTIIFRSFIYSFQNDKTVIKDNLLIQLSKEKSLDYMKPIYLFKLIFDYEILQFLLKKIKILFDPNQEITTSFLTEKAIKKYGDRDVVKKSISSFIKTLVHFEIISKTSNKSFIFNNKSVISNDQLLNILSIYSITYLNSKQIELSTFLDNLFDLYIIPDLYDFASEFNQEKWEYIRDGSRNILLLY